MTETTRGFTLPADPATEKFWAEVPNGKPPIERYGDGSYRFRVYFDGEVRDVYARTPERAKKTAEKAQAITNAPKKARRAHSVRIVDPTTNRSYPCGDDRQPSLV